MGEYFKWANFDKRKVLSNDLWDEGIELACFARANSERNDAVATLLAGPWSGDRVILCGDEAHFSEDDDNEVKRQLAPLWPDNLPYDWDDDSSCEDGGLFKIAKGRTREVWLEGCHSPVELPFEGPFSVSIEKVRYIVNESKMEYVDRMCGPVSAVLPGKVYREDLFPLLCCSRDHWAGQDPDGRWFGDRLRASNERPGSEYLDRSNSYECMGIATHLSDDDVLSAYAESHFGKAGILVELGNLTELLRSCKG